MHLSAFCNETSLKKFIAKTYLALYRLRRNKQIFRIMKLAAFLLIVSFHVSATGVSQITLSEKNAPLEKVFNAIEKQSGYVFFYDYAWLDEAKTVSIKVKNAPLADVLNVCFEGQPLTYSIIGKTVVVKQKEPIKAVSPVLPPPPPPRIITGTVTDEKGAPLAGVSISIKGTSFGTTTNEKGFFRLELAQDNDVLLISYVGYAEQEVVVGSQANININLQPLSKGIDEIVVVGYGTQKKRDLTGSVATIDQETIKDLSVASIDQKMIGQVAGVQIQQVSGAPGAGTSVKIRGSGSLGAGNEPLYVIDGMPYSSGLN